MARYTEEEELREDYYIHCRKRGYAVDEASERSLAYMKRVFNAESLTNTSYLEQLYQERIELTDDSRSSRNMGMELEESWSIPSVPSYRIPECIPSSWDYQSNAREPLKELPNDRSTLHYRAPEYIPSIYDYQSNVQKPREGSDRCTDSDDTPPRSSSYNRPSRSRSNSSYKTGSRRPFPSHSYSASDSNNPPRSRPSPSYTFYSSPDEYSTNSSYSFRPSAASSSSYTRPPLLQRPVTPPPQGIKPATDLYILLGIGRRATAADIKKAHRAMSLKWHPDRCHGQDKNKATEKMAEINQANDVLGAEEKRKFYDRWGVLPSEL